MKVLYQPAIDRIGLSVLRGILHFGTLGVSLLCSFLLFEAEKKYKIRLAGVAGGIVAVLGIFVSFVSVPAVIERMRADKAMYLGEAITHTFYSHLMVASFLPFVGTYVSRAFKAKEKENPFTQGEE